MVCLLSKYINSCGQDQELAFGAKKSRIDLPMFKKFTVPLPPIDEQHEIVRKVDLLFELIEKLGKQLATAHSEMNRLVSIVLEKAFQA